MGLFYLIRYRGKEKGESPALPAKVGKGVSKLNLSAEGGDLLSQGDRSLFFFAGGRKGVYWIYGLDKPFPNRVEKKK